MVHPRPTPSPRTGARQRLASSVAGRVLALTMMVGAAHQPARAQTADDSAVVVQTPRAADPAGAYAPGASETIAALADGLATKAAETETVTRDFGVCLTEAERLLEEAAQRNAKAACHVANAVDKKTFFESMQPMLFDASAAFTAEAQAQGAIRAGLEAKLKEVTAAEAEAQQTTQALLEGYKGKLATLDPTAPLSREDDREIRELVRLVQRAIIQADRAIKTRGSIEQKLTYSQALEGNLGDWGYELDQAARDMVIGIEAQTARLEGLREDAESAMVQDQTVGLPGVLGGLGSTVSGMSSFMATPDPSADPAQASETVQFEAPPAGASPVAALLQLYLQAGIDTGLPQVEGQ